MTDKTLVPDPAAPKPGSEDAPVGASTSPSAGALLTPGASKSAAAAKDEPPGKSVSDARSPTMTPTVPPVVTPTVSPAVPPVASGPSTSRMSSTSGSGLPQAGSRPKGGATVSPTGAASMGHAPVGTGSTGTTPNSASVPPNGPVSGTSTPPHNGGRSGHFGWLVILLVVLCVALGAALWYQRQQFEAAGMNVATRIDGLSNELAQTRRDTREALSLAQSQTAKIAAIENAVRENQAEYTTLEQAWQDFNDTTNDGVLANDVERLLTIASQQLRLGGSVNNAIVALESAQSRLARADRPRFASLQQAVNGDLDRLRAVPVVDVAAQSARIERLSGLVSKAPLLVPDLQSMNQTTTTTTEEPAQRPAAPQVQAVAADAPWWQHWRAEIVSWPSRAGSMLTHELGDLIKVQRVDQPGALLMSASQSEQLRGALRQRLQTVQLALLMRQASVWKNELSIVSSTLTNYYEPRSADTQAALRLAESLAEIPVAVALPEISDSLNAMAAVRSQASPETERN